MYFKIIRQIDDSVTIEFYNAKGKKIDYEIVNVEKDGLGYLYTIKGLRISSHGKKKDETKMDKTNS